MSEQQQEDKGQFVQFPVQLIYGRNDLTRDDKWVLLAIMGKCWESGSYRLSYRGIASISNTPLSLLASSTNKKTGQRREGIIDRLTRVTDYLNVTIDKEVDPITGEPRKQAQLYVTINYAAIWRDNAAYCAEKKAKSVPHANTSYTKSVPHANASVPNTNGSVPHANGSVHNASVNDPPYITVDYLDSNRQDTYTNTNVFDTSPAPVPQEEVPLSDEPFVPDFIRTQEVHHVPASGTPHPSRSDLPAHSVTGQASEDPASTTLQASHGQAAPGQSEQAVPETALDGHELPVSTPVAGDMAPVGDSGVAGGRVGRVTTQKTQDAAASTADTVQKTASRRTSKKADAPKPELTEGGRRVYEAWCSLFKAPIPPHPSIVTGANALASGVAIWAEILGWTPAQVLDDIQKHLYKTDKTGYYRRGVKLYDCSREFEGWQSAKEREQAKPEMSPEMAYIESLFAAEAQNTYAGGMVN